MKSFFVLSVVTMLFSPGRITAAGEKTVVPHNRPDTFIITHQFDGMTNEWPESFFETDKETGIRYAAHNNDEFFFVAIQIPGQAIQMKMMRMGMLFFIDVKAKKKENTGIEFPIKREITGNGTAIPPSSVGESQGRMDPKAMRIAMASSLFKLKLFGFNNEETREQGLMVPGSAGIAFSWDSSDVMYIEYQIPVVLIEKPAALHNKTISIGWKINGMQVPSGTGSTVPPGTRGRMPAPGRAAGGGMPGQPVMEQLIQEQSFWSKYTFLFPSPVN